MNPSLFLPAAGMSPSLVRFTLNFTITSLRYTEGMGNPGSEIFNTVERLLNHLVRAPPVPTFVLPRSLARLLTSLSFIPSSNPYSRTAVLGPSILAAAWPC